MRKKQWSDLSSRQRAGLVGAGIVQVSLQLAALVDLYRRPREQVKGHKAAWVAASFVNTFGPLAYFEYGRRR
jgi:phospholipase D-like protein